MWGPTQLNTLIGKIGILFLRAWQKRKQVMCMRKRDIVEGADGIGITSFSRSGNDEFAVVFKL